MKCRTMPRRVEESRHNLLYWQGGDWLGIGPGAHGRLRREDGLRATRQFRAPNRWLESVAAQGHGTEEAGIVSPADDEIELLMMGLRLEAGVSAARFERLTGTTLEAALDAQGLAAMLSGEMVEWRDGHLRATAAGMPVLNSVLARLLP